MEFRRNGMQYHVRMQRQAGWRFSGTWEYKAQGAVTHGDVHCRVRTLDGAVDVTDADLPIVGKWFEEIDWGMGVLKAVDTLATATEE